MLHIVLTILKIIGIILLIILGIVLFLVLSVLFVPLRYRGRVSYLGELKGDVKVSWLLHILSFRMQYNDGLKAVLRVFGVPVKRMNLFDKLEAEAEAEAEEYVETDEDAGETSGAWKEREAEREKQEHAAQAKPACEGTKASEAGREIAAEVPPDAGQMQMREATPEPPDAEPESADQLPGTEPEPADQLPDAEPESADQLPGTEPEPADQSQGAGQTESRRTKRQADEAVPRIPFYERIKKRFEKFFKKLRFSFTRFCDKLKEIKDKKDKYLAFIHDEENKKTFALVIREGRRLLKHVLPRRLKGRVAFGFDDPYTTGQVLMYVSPFLGWYHKQLSLEPYFDRELFEGEVDFRGKIRIGTVLWIGFIVYRDRNFRKILKHFRD